MSGLFGLLNLGAGAMLAQNAGVAVTGRNIANVDTEGYSRESVDLNSERRSPYVGGVRAGDPKRAESNLLSARERNAAGSWGRADEAAAALGAVEGALTGANITGAMAGFFGAATELSAAPMDEALRRNLVARAGEFSDALRQASEAIAQASGEAQARIVDLSKEANQLSQRIAEANKALGQQYDPVMADKRDQAAKQLSELTGGQARVDGDGMMRFVTEGGAVLVDGVKANQIVGQAGKVSVVDGTHTDDITATVGGRIGAAAELGSGGAAAQAQKDLDQLAFDFVGAVNTAHRGGTGLDGAGGRDLFVAPASATGAAKGLAIDPAILADPRKLAAAGPGEGAGGATNLLNIAKLADTKLAGGNNRTFLEEGIRVISDVGGSAASANAARDTEATRVQTLAGMRDSLSGVSQDEELTKLASFQRASEAAAKFVGVVNGLLGTVLDIG